MKLYMIILVRHASSIINNDYCSNKTARARMFQYNETDQLRYEEIDPFIHELRDLILRGMNSIVTPPLYLVQSIQPSTFSMD